jgi:tRNA-dihydrouridine synthase
LPVSVKVRLGDTVNQIEEWIPALLEAKPAAITIHGRTRKEMSKVPACWDDIARCVEIRNEWSIAQDISPDEQTLIVGNGDAEGLEDAREKAERYGVDGVMLGRAIFGNPWLFNDKKDKETISERERLVALLKHAEYFNEMLGEVKPFHIMRKHFGSYVSGFANAKALREKLMVTENMEAVRLLIKEELLKLETSD